MPYADPTSKKARRSAVKRSLAYQVKNPEKCAEWHAKASRNWRLKKFGITVAQFDALLESQGGHCAICRVDSPKGRGRGNWCVDHNHETGQIRGLLCHNCNVSLGMMREDTDALVAMIAYLEEHAMFGPLKRDLTPLSRHGAIHKVAGKGHMPFKPSHPPGQYLKTQAAQQAPMAAHANPLPPPPPPMAPPMAGPPMAPPPPPPMMNPAQDDAGGQGPSGGI